jgi:hypothetical protein
VLPSVESGYHNSEEPIGIQVCLSFRLTALRKLRPPYQLELKGSIFSSFYCARAAHGVCLENPFSFLVVNASSWASLAKVVAGGAGELGRLGE